MGGGRGNKRFMNLEDLAQLLRYVVSGVAAFATNFLIYLLFLKVFNFHYILSSIIAFFSGLIVSFMMQKFFTFQNVEADQVSAQLVKHILLVVFNLGANTLLLVVCIESFGLSEVISPIITNGIVAIWSFFVYRVIIFKKLETEFQKISK